MELRHLTYPAGLGLDRGLETEGREAARAARICR